MFGGVNPKQMQAMMKKMGISQTPIHAKRVIFETNEGNLIIDEPDVLKIMMQGQESYQITGEARLEEESNNEEEKYTEEDIKMIIEKTKKKREEVISALEENDYDIASTIIQLKD